MHLSKEIDQTVNKRYDPENNLAFYHATEQRWNQEAFLGITGGTKKICFL
jgi:hypothetical protein